jgi:hypothetical protein
MFNSKQYQRYNRKYTKNEEIKFGGTKITSSNINARKNGIRSFSTREKEGHQRRLVRILKR